MHLWVMVQLRNRNHQLPGCHQYFESRLTAAAEFTLSSSRACTTYWCICNRSHWIEFWLNYLWMGPLKWRWAVRYVVRLVFWLNFNLIIFPDTLKLFLSFLSVVTWNDYSHNYQLHKCRNNAVKCKNAQLNKLYICYV